MGISFLLVFFPPFFSPPLPDLPSSTRSVSTPSVSGMSVRSVHVSPSLYYVYGNNTSIPPIIPMSI